MAQLELQEITRLTLDGTIEVSYQITKSVPGSSATLYQLKSKKDAEKIFTKLAEGTPPKKIVTIQAAEN